MSDKGDELIRFRRYTSNNSTSERLSVLSTTAEYALRMMIALAEAEGRPLTSEQLSRRTDVSPDYAVKILQQLGRAKFVRAQRGRGGGFRLACDASTTTLLDLVRVIDPLDRITKCPLGRVEHEGHLCALHASIDRAIGVLHDELRSYTLNDLLEDERGTICAADSETIQIGIERRHNGSISGSN